MSHRKYSKHVKRLHCDTLSSNFRNTQQLKLYTCETKWNINIWHETFYLRHSLFIKACTTDYGTSTIQDDKNLDNHHTMMYNPYWTPSLAFRNKLHIHMASFIQLNISFSWVWDTCLASWTIVAAEVWNQRNANINIKSNLKPLTNPSTLLHSNLLYQPNSNCIYDAVNLVTVHKVKSLLYLTDYYMWWDTLNNLHEYLFASSQHIVHGYYFGHI